jgi:RNA recognition motif-containing protein
MSNKLFVGNLSFNTTENDLNDAFAAHGTVTEANLMMDRMSGRPRGFGFVTMSSAAEAQAAIDGLNGKELDGRALTVNVAKPREERSAAVAAAGANTGSAVAVAVATKRLIFCSGVRVSRTPLFILSRSVRSHERRSY